ncbi:MAG: cation diffusion facilitator family transporter [Candidatus Eisenbacteria bacterium]
MNRHEAGLQASGTSVAVNIILAVVKVATGLVGHSYALVADGIESMADVISSVIVWSGLRFSARPPDRTHPYGHGKAESLAGIAVPIFLLVAAVVIALQSIRTILSPRGVPAWYTLVVLGLVILVKEWMFRRLDRTGREIGSTSLKGDAWHHRSDALTSLAAFIGIAIALAGGPRYASADGWAAVVAAVFIFANGVRLLRPAVDEVMDAAVDEETIGKIRSAASEVDGVVDVEKCRARKSGLGLLTDIHVVVDGKISVREGHRIGHDVKDRVVESSLGVYDVVVHIEPDDLDHECEVDQRPD